ncbi:hypothetical protein CPLU01_10238 [Colletotrichum plurivorum]|uniref:Uncharacterized protein n=1 Tax=Colletotrichum plurivorum TaxID=2175906 RepID=A0A8H6K6S2_9PEZI|nr:hypothetical protein CPLU01_10238 [Colletotrichum plurivorum]
MPSAARKSRPDDDPRSTSSRYLRRRRLLACPLNCRPLGHLISPTPQEASPHPPTHCCVLPACHVHYTTPEFAPTLEGASVVRGSYIGPWYRAQKLAMIHADVRQLPACVAPSSSNPVTTAIVRPLALRKPAACRATISIQAHRHFHQGATAIWPQQQAANSHGSQSVLRGESTKVLDGWQSPNERHLLATLTATLQPSMRLSHVSGPCAGQANRPLVASDWRTRNAQTRSMPTLHHGDAPVQHTVALVKKDARTSGPLLDSCAGLPC